MTQSDAEKRPSRLQRLANFAGLIFRAMGSEMGQPSEEVIREERSKRRAHETHGKEQKSNEPANHANGQE
ncbi:MAG: hypothetical protein V5A14_01025 [Desulfohalobiaceae bacterium]